MTDIREHVLKIKHISVIFDGFKALTDVDINVKRNSIHFFIGPNGAGKTTLLDIICARTKPTSGTVHYYPLGRNAVRLTGMKVPSVFTALTVMENMVLSLKGHKRVWESLFYKLSDKDERAVMEVLGKVGLADRADVRAGSLAHGEKQWLEIAMQLVQKPEIIMLDEPAAGMGKPETFRTGELLKEIKKDCTVIVVEHDMDFVKQIADTVTVLHEGKVLMEGGVGEVLADQTVQAVYLGRGGERYAGN